jgi:N-acetylmuramoyl-L-alanine amidase
MNDGLTITSVLPMLAYRRIVVAAAFASILAAPSARAAEPVVILFDTHRREVLPVTRGSVEMLPVESVIAGMGVGTHTDAAAGSVTLTYQGRELVLYHNKSLASVAGELRLLSAPSILDEGRWLVPIDGLPRLLGYLLGKPVEWRAPSRVLSIGDVRIPRIVVNAFVSGDSVRVVLDSTEKVPFRVSQGDGRVLVAIARDLIEVKLEQERLTGGIVDVLQYVPGKENTLSITLGKRFQNLKASEQEAPPRLVLEFLAAPAPLAARTATAAPGGAPAATATPTPAARNARVIVIDPGHGGPLVGAQGGGGALEKDVTLAIARKLRGAISNNLGYQAFLTRDKDEDITLDQRTAIANNYKADVFISIHANGSRATGAKGSEVYFLAYEASDAEARRLAMVEGAISPDVSAAPGSDLALILWDMAQAQHLEASSALASRVHEALGEVTGSSTRGVKQAPFRVLVGATMPAVLVEIGFLSNPEEEKLLTNDAYQSRVAAAIAKGMGRFFERYGGGGASGSR